MHITNVATSCLLILFLLPTFPIRAETSPAVFERAMSDTLDLWREKHYEQLFNRIAHRGKTSRESFVKKMSEAVVRPACCFKKMDNFKVLNEKNTKATVYVKIGLEGVPNVTESCTREFKMTHEDGIWKMRLSDIYSMAGVPGKKKKMHHN